MSIIAYTVYKHSFPNGKIYIGITSLKPKYRWGNDGNGYLHKTNEKYNQPKIAHAIQKYGWENVQHEILYENLTKEEAEQKEIDLIAKYQSNNIKFGYNVDNGGNCSGKVSDETKRKISKVHKGRKVSENTRIKMSESQKGEKHHFYGKHHSDKHKAKISNLLKGRKLSEETKEKMGKAKSGEKHPMYGKQRPEKTLEKYRKAVRCIETGEVYHSISQASIETGIIISSISKACKGKLKTAGGYHWEYTTKEETR